MKAILHTDGGARGNPGPAGIGVVLTDEAGAILGERARALGIQTNNVAEYEALIAGLELALEHGVTDLEVRMDSQLVVSQMRGEWKIKNDRLRQLAVKAQGLQRRFARVHLVHVRRAENARADELANEAMDRVEESQDAGKPESLF